MKAGSTHNNTTRERAILQWLAKGRVGTSSRTLALASVGIKMEDCFGPDAPRDAGDSERCEILARMCPFVVEALPQLIQDNPRWAVWADRIRESANGAR